MEKPCRIRRYFTLKMQVKFLTRFTELVENGFSIMDALEVMNTIFSKHFIDLMITACLRGEKFSETLSTLQFEKRIIYIIRASENNNALLKGLQKARDYSDNYLKNREEMKKKLRYPFFLFSMVIIILAAVFIFFIPRLANFYETFGIYGGSSPITGIISVLGFILIAITILIVAVTFVLKFDNNKFQKWNVLWMFKLPGFKILSQKLFSYYFATQISMFIGCGLSLKDSINTIKEFEKIFVIKIIITEFETHLEEGKSIEELIINANYFTPYFRLIVLHSLRIGNLESEFNKFVKSELTNLNFGLSNFIKIFQAVFLALIGCLIILLYLSVLQPVFELIQII